MATLTITDAARVTGVSRMLLYRYIKSGKLSRTPEGLLDTAELLRAGLLLHTSDVTSTVTPLHDVTPLPVTPETRVTSAVTPPVTASVTPTDSSEIRTLERLIDVLQCELDAARARETLLLQMLSQFHQQNQRLLDMPRQDLQAAPAAMPTRGSSLGTLSAPGVPTRPPGTPYTDARGTMRREIIALLHDHPKGLTPAAMRTLLGATKRLAQTCLGMRRDGLLRRVERGRYALP